MEAVWKETKSDELMDSKLRYVFEMPKENDKLNYMEPRKAVPLNASKQDGPMPKPGLNAMILKRGNSWKSVKDFREK